MSKYKQLYLQSQLQVNGLIDKINGGFFNPMSVIGKNKESYIKMLQEKDAILCTNRFEWTLPVNLTSQQLELLFYKNGSLCMYVENGELVFSRFTKQGALNTYGLLSDIHPIDFAGKKHSRKKMVINGDGGVPAPDGDFAIIINDYTGTLSEHGQVLPRMSLNLETTISDEAEVYVQLMNNIVLSIKKAIALCDNEEQARAVFSQVEEILSSSSPIMPISKSKKGGKAMSEVLEMFNLNNTFDTQNYCQTIDFYNKVRRSFNGIPAPDTFEKKERKITSEAEDTSTHTMLVLLDGLMQRQVGILLAKKYFKDARGIDTLSVKLNDVLEQKEETDDSGEGDATKQKTKSEVD